MKTQELYHGTTGARILDILKEGLMRPNNGELYFVRNEALLHEAFPYGADESLRARFVIKVKATIPDGLTLKPKARQGAPSDTWVLETHKAIAVAVLKLFIQRRPGEPVETKAGTSEIGSYLRSLPKAFKVVIDRKISCPDGILGELSANGTFICYTLELAWWWNQKNKSCIPLGRYHGFVRHDHKDKWRIELTGVPGHREHVQIHVGNFPRDIKGCVLVGTSYKLDTVLNSTQAYEKLKAAYAKASGPITVEFKGILASPWGDYPSQSSSVV